MKPVNIFWWNLLLKHEASSKQPLSCLFFNHSVDKYGCPGIWFADTFSTSPLQLTHTGSLRFSAQEPRNLKKRSTLDLNPLFKLAFCGVSTKRWCKKWVPEQRISDFLTWSIFSMPSIKLMYLRLILPQIAALADTFVTSLQLSYGFQHQMFFWLMI